MRRTNNFYLSINGSYDYDVRNAETAEVVNDNFADDAYDLFAEILTTTAFSEWFDFWFDNWEVYKRTPNGETHHRNPVALQRYRPHKGRKVRTMLDSNYWFDEWYPRGVRANAGYTFIVDHKAIKKLDNSKSFYDSHEFACFKYFSEYTDKGVHVTNMTLTNALDWLLTE